VIQHPTSKRQYTTVGTESVARLNRPCNAHRVLHSKLE
jgi:hypothetical protein